MASTNTNNQDIEALRSDLEALRNDVGSLAAGLKETSADKAKAGIQSASASARSAASRVEDEVRNRPMTSVLAAFGVGFALGKLLDR